MRSAIASCAILIAVGSCTSAPRMQDPARKIDALMSEYAGSSVPGASVVVVRDGQPVLMRAYGMADLDQKIAVTPTTNYRLASLTKQFTAFATLVLADRGKLSLDDRISRFFPDFPAYGVDITVRHLLTHTSGLPDYEDYIPEGTTVPLLDADVLSIVERNRPLFAPGQRYRYSNSGYALLALIVQRAWGKSFASFLHDEIFVPLQMNNTVAYEKGISTVSERAYGYSRSGGNWTRTDQSMTSSVLGDGGIYTSIDDLVRWDRELGSPHIVRAATLAMAFAPAVAVDDQPGKVDYGFGWRISDYRTHHTVWHTGETIGFRNAILRFPTERLTVVVLTNRSEGEPINIARKIADLYLSLPLSPREK